MGISFECGSCGKPFDVGVEFAGKTGRCKRCGATMQIPLVDQASPSPDGFDRDEPVQPFASAAGSSAERPAPAGGRPGAEPGVNQSIAALAAQIRSGQKGVRPKQGSGVPWVVVGVGLAVAAVPIMMILLALLLPAVQAARNAARKAAEKQQAKSMTPELARQFIQTDIAKYANGPIALPRFPDLGPGEEHEPGVTRHEVVFGPTPTPLEAPPGMGGKLWVYLPTGAHADHSLPAVLVTGAGSNLLTGMELGAADRKEHLPYVAAGFAVVAYELDGMNHDETESDQKATEAMWRFNKARAGLINAHIALEYVLAKVPAIDPSRISAAGHSSAGALAVLFAETEPRLKSAVAYAPALDYAKRFGPETVAMITRAGFGALVTRYAPLTGVGDLKCPLLLFQAQDDSNVPVADTEAFVAQAQADGKEVTLDLVPSGGHYQAMIDEGIPHAIAWLKGEPIPHRVAQTGSEPAAPPDVEDQPAPRPSAAQQQGREPQPGAQP